MSNNRPPSPTFLSSSTYKDMQAREKSKADENAFLKDYEKEIAYFPCEGGSRAMTQQMLYLLHDLDNTLTENVLFISIGCSATDTKLKDQQLPPFIYDLAKQTPVRSLLIDGLLRNTTPMAKRENKNETYIDFFEKSHPVQRDLSKEDEHYTFSSKQDSMTLHINLLACLLPETNPFFYKKMEDTIRSVLDRGGKVHIANHIQAWSLEDTIQVAIVYNNIKSSHPNAASLQLYTQGGKGKVRYYLDNLYESASSLRREDNIFTPSGNESYVCDRIADLSAIYEKQNALVASAKLDKR